MKKVWRVAWPAVRMYRRSVKSEDRGEIHAERMQDVQENGRFEVESSRDYCNTKTGGLLDAL
jgi:hypothetical protein